MTIRELTNLDLKLYEETLDNGLRIFIIPKNNITSVYTTFTTKYGAYQSEFIPKGKTEMVKVPLGVAHFLEHKVFEQKDGPSPHVFFSQNGVGSNASTSYFKTTYLVDGSYNFYKNLEFLLNFVQEPYFTEENVEKEKKIIEQEIDMHSDSPYRRATEILFKNAFVNLPIREKVIGTKKSINEITVDDLNICYNTFYHPSNMFLVVTGNVIPEEVIAFVKENQNKKNYGPGNKIIIKKYEEPDEVRVKKEVLNMNVTIPKITVAYKINKNKLNETLNFTNSQIKWYLGIFNSMKFGIISEFSRIQKEKGIIANNISFEHDIVEDVILCSYDAETKYADILEKEIEKELTNLDVSKSDFILKKKVLISSGIYMTDDIHSLNSKIINDIINEDTVNVNVAIDCQKINFEDFKKFINRLDFTNKTVVIVNPNEK